MELIGQKRLAADISVVFEEHLRRLHNLLPAGGLHLFNSRGQRRDVARKDFDAELRTENKLLQAASLAQRRKLQVGTRERKFAVYGFNSAVPIGHLHRARAHEIYQRVALPALALHKLHALAGGQPQGVGPRCKAHVGIILAQEDAVFRARGEHAVRLVDPLCHQVVDKHTDISLVASKHKRAPLGRVGVKCRESRIGSRHQPLAGSLLITGGAVDLPGEKEGVHKFRLKSVAQLRGVKEIIFDSVARTVNLHIGQGRDGA